MDRTKTTPEQPELALDHPSVPNWRARGPLDRLRRRNSLPILPDTYEPLLRLVGMECTLRFIRRYGGSDARFPARPGPGHDMVRILGPENLMELRRQFGPLDIHWPAASDFLALVDARSLRIEGRSTRDIARILYRDPKTIERYVKGMIMQRRTQTEHPLPLFNMGSATSETP